MNWEEFNDEMEERELLSNDWLEPVEDEVDVVDQSTQRLDYWKPIFVLELKSDPGNGVERGFVMEYFLECGRLLEKQGQDEQITACVFLGPCADRPDMGNGEGEQSVLIAVRESVEESEGMVERLVPLVRLKLADEAPVRSEQRSDALSRLLEVRLAGGSDGELRPMLGRPSFRDERQFPDEIVERGA